MRRKIDRPSFSVSLATVSVHQCRAILFGSGEWPNDIACGWRIAARWQPRHEGAAAIAPAGAVRSSRGERRFGDWQRGAGTVPGLVAGRRRATRSSAADRGYSRSASHCESVARSTRSNKSCRLMHSTQQESTIALRSSTFLNNRTSSDCLRCRAAGTESEAVSAGTGR